MAAFVDRFGGQAATYASFRPTYPDALYTFLAEASPSRARAWDCATGSGQAALALAEHFETVIATDASAAQLDQAHPHLRVIYRVASAEASGLDAASVDLITVAQALHWFDRPAFFAEVERVLKPGGVLAVWTYLLPAITSAIDALTRHLYYDVLGPYWAFERTLVENRYTSVAFPFESVETPAFAMEVAWSLDALVGFLGSGSALQTYRQTIGVDPLPEIVAALTEAWGDPGELRPARWPLTAYVRRKPA